MFNNQGEPHCIDGGCRMRRVSITEMSGSQILQAHINAVEREAARNYWDAVRRRDETADN